MKPDTHSLSSDFAAGFASIAHSALSSSSVFGASTSIQFTSVPSSSVAVEISLEHLQLSSTINLRRYCPGRSRSTVLKSCVLRISPESVLAPTSSSS